MPSSQRGKPDALQGAVSGCRGAEAALVYYKPLARKYSPKKPKKRSEPREIAD